MLHDDQWRYSSGESIVNNIAAARIATGLLTATVLCVLAYSAAVRADDSPKRFDGSWDTILSCSNAAGALGYSFEFLSTVKDGVLHGEKGANGEPGWLQVDGTIPPDGHANLYAKGLVGASEVAVGHRPAGTAYGYHVDAEFTDTSGKGHRVEGRPCTVTFSKKP
jgi:hypothetical protein